MWYVPQPFHYLKFKVEFLREDLCLFSVFNTCTINFSWIPQTRNLRYCFNLLKRNE